MECSQAIYTIWAIGRERRRSAVQRNCSGTEVRRRVLESVRDARYARGHVQWELRRALLPELDGHDGLIVANVRLNASPDQNGAKSLLPCCATSARGRYSTHRQRKIRQSVRWTVRGRHGETAGRQVSLQCSLICRYRCCLHVIIWRGVSPADAEKRCPSAALRPAPVRLGKRGDKRAPSVV